MVRLQLLSDPGSWCSGTGRGLRQLPVFSSRVAASLGTGSGAWSITTAPGGRGVVSVALGGMGLRALTASFSFAPLSFARDSREARALDRAAGCSWGVPWGRIARVEVRKWWFGTTMATDATEDDIEGVLVPDFESAG